MSKIKFDEEGYNYVEINKDKEGINIILSSQDFINNKKTIINSVILSNEQFKELIKDIDME